MKFVSVVLLLVAPALSSCQLPTDCHDLYTANNNLTSGVYIVYPIALAPVQVYCDMDAVGGRWMVIQRRKDGTVNFYRPWVQYVNGFGNAAGEYWLGLENIHQLTRKRAHQLLVDMEDFEGNKVFALYPSFSVGAESDQYILNVTGFVDGGAGDSLAYQNGQPFSTFDRNNVVCAKKYLGAFWYNECHHANPNGIYRWGADGTYFALGVEWKTWKGYDYSLKAISMKIRPV